MASAESTNVDSFINALEGIPRLTNAEVPAAVLLTPIATELLFQSPVLFVASSGSFHNHDHGSLHQILLPSITTTIRNCIINLNNISVVCYDRSSVCWLTFAPTAVTAANTANA